MGTCMARRGFLTLGDCDNPAMTMCSTCGRAMCTMHLSPQSGFTQCLDCAATNPQAEGEEGEYDGVWAHRYRDEYYTSTGYTPMYSGSRTDSYYDSQDVRSFDDDVNGVATDEGDEEMGGFDES